MCNRFVATTVMIAVSLAAFQQANADFGSLLDKIPVFSRPGQDASASADSDAGLQPPKPPSQSTEPVLVVPTPGQLMDVDADLDFVDQPSRGSSSEPRLRSSVPPPHVPDDSVGLQSEESLIESDAEHAVESTVPPPLPPSFEMEEPSPSSDEIVSSQARAQATGCACQHCNSHHHGHGAAAIDHAAPVPYIYAGPGFPPPATLEAFSRTPDCYRGLWDGYAEEKQRRCVKSHAHLHGYCDCHRVNAQPCHRGHGGGRDGVRQPRGTCANAPAPGITR